jgi:hypothetical protein
MKTPGQRIANSTHRASRHMTRPTESVNQLLIEQDEAEDDLTSPGIFTRLRPIAVWVFVGIGVLYLLIRL